MKSPKQNASKNQSQEPVATWLDSARASEDHALEIAKSNPIPSGNPT